MAGQNTKITSVVEHFTGSNGFYVARGYCEQLKNRYDMHFTIGSRTTANAANAEFAIGSLDIRPAQKTTVGIIALNNNVPIGYGTLTVNTDSSCSINLNVSRSYLVIDVSITLHT